MRSRALPLVVFLLLFGSSCASIQSALPGGIPQRLDADEVEDAILRAQTELDSGSNKRAMKWMQAANKAEGLEPDVRVRVRALLESAARARIEELARDGDPDDLAEFLTFELPRQIAVDAAIRGAQAMVAQADYLDAFRVIKRLDVKFPTHHRRADAGRLLAQAGLSIAADESKFLFIFPRKERATEVLEYLVLNYPSESRCDEAYATLASLYEGNELWEKSIEKHLDLLLYHPDSTLALASEARIPKLRLISVGSPEYDRRELVRARDELQSWLERHPDSELEQEVRLDLADSLVRLHESDMGIARFYRRVENPFGARFHAERAAKEAAAAGDTKREQKARDFLAAIQDERQGDQVPQDPTDGVLPTDPERETP